MEGPQTGLSSGVARAVWPPAPVLPLQDRYSDKTMQRAQAQPDVHRGPGPGHCAWPGAAAEGPHARGGAVALPRSSWALGRFSRDHDYKFWGPALESSDDTRDV